MAREVAPELTELLVAHPLALGAAVLIDLAIGDPAYRWHPIRLIGGTIAGLERLLRRIGADGYGGGILLCIGLATFWVVALSGVVLAVATLSRTLGWILHVLLAYSLLALGDLVRHVWRIEASLARGDLASSRSAIGQLVGRDTESMDVAACRRAAVESLSENITDGVTSPVFWYVVAGLPGLVIFKVVSTLDSMVGYRTPEYLRFGWCGARLDDVMNYVPARLTWLLMSAVAAVLPRYSGRKALRVGLRQHALVPGPNSGWSEAAMAGALERRLVGPIRRHGRLVTDLWLGDPADPPLAAHDDVTRAIAFATTTAMVWAALAVAVLL